MENKITEKTKHCLEWDWHRCHSTSKADEEAAEKACNEFSMEVTQKQMDAYERSEYPYEEVHWYKKADDEIHKLFGKHGGGRDDKWSVSFVPIISKLKNK